MGKSARRKQERLGEKLKAIRLALGLSQNEMIGRLGLAGEILRSRISEFESADREPPLYILLEYARVAGVCIDVLADDKRDLPKKLPSIPDH
jgi:transcriptional regulator with XRE-family HTH domain